MSRAPWGTGSLTYASFKYEGDSVWAVLWNCPTPFRLEYLTNLSWFLHRKVLGILLMWVGFLYTHKYSQKHKCFLFSIRSTSKGVTPVILRQIDSCIAHYRPRCHFITFSESYRSVISILNPLPVILCQKSFFVYTTIYE